MGGAGFADRKTPDEGCESPGHRGKVHADVDGRQGIEQETEEGLPVLQVDPATPANLYAGTWGGPAFKSTNGGGNWEPVNTGPPDMLEVSTLAIDPAMTITLYAEFAWGGVFKSTNGGGNWEAVNPGLSTVSLLSRQPGVEAMKMLQNLIEGEKLPVEQKSLPVEMVSRLALYSKKRRKNETICS